MPRKMGVAAASPKIERFKKERKKKLMWARGRRGCTSFNGLGEPQKEMQTTVVYFQWHVCFCYRVVHPAHRWR